MLLQCMEITDVVNIKPISGMKTSRSTICMCHAPYRLWPTSLMTSKLSPYLGSRNAHKWTYCVSLMITSVCRNVSHTWKLILSVGHVTLTLHLNYMAETKLEIPKAINKLHECIALELLNKTISFRVNKVSIYCRPPL